MKNLVKRSMKLFGSVALLLGVLVIGPNSSFFAYQPKCPDELLK